MTFDEQIDRQNGAPAHQQVRERILVLMRDQGLDVGAKLPSEVEIAERLGVSRMTANKSIQRLVAEGWLERAKGRGTFVARVPGSIAITRCTVLVNIDPEWSSLDYYFGALYGVLHRCLDDLNVGMRIQRVDDSLEAKLGPLDGHGIVSINPTPETVRRLEALQEAGARCVILGAMWPGSTVACFDSDNVLGTVLAVDHLADLGHQDLLFVGGWATDANTRDRVRGFEIGVKARRLPATPARLIVAARTLEPKSAEEERLADVLLSQDRPSAIVVAGARLTVQVLSLVRRVGLEAPADVSVVGYDDPDLFALSYPRVTTVRQPLEAMAEAACDALVIPGEHAKHRTFDPELIVRDSTTAHRL